MDSPAKHRVVVIDDEPNIGRLLTYSLNEAGFEAVWAATGAEGIGLVERLRPTVAVVDMMLPDLSGAEVCERLRAMPATGELAILILSALGEEEDRVVGFEAGADDYVVKPYSPREFCLRVKALARRVAERPIGGGGGGSGVGGTSHGAGAAAAIGGASQRLTWSGLVLDDVRHAVFLDGEEVALRPLEYKLLAAFLEHPDNMFTRAQLLELVWGMSKGIGDRTVDVHIRRLRSRLGAYAAAIETVAGFGYRLKSAPK